MNTRRNVLVFLPSLLLLPTTVGIQNGKQDIVLFVQCVYWPFSFHLLRKRQRGLETDRVRQRWRSKSLGDRKKWLIFIIFDKNARATTVQKFANFPFSYFAFDCRLFAHWTFLIIDSIIFSLSTPLSLSPSLCFCLFVSMSLFLSLPSHIVCDLYLDVK